MEAYEKLWKEKKKKLADIIMKSPNAAAASREARELAEMERMENFMFGDSISIDGDVICNNFSMDDFTDVIEPVLDFLHKNFHPMTAVIIEDGFVKIVSGCLENTGRK